MSQVFKNLIGNRIVMVLSISIVSLIFSLFIHSAWAAVYKAPSDNPPLGGPNPPVFNDVERLGDDYDDEILAYVDRHVTIGGSLGVIGNLTFESLANCNTVDTNAVGELVCGTDESGAGIIDINTQTTGLLPLTRTTGSLDISTRTTGNLPYSRVSGTPPSLVCDWSGVRNACGDGYAITCTGGVVTRVAAPTPNQSTNPSAACFVPACEWDGLFIPCGTGTTPTCTDGVLGAPVAQIPYQTTNPAAACYFELVIPPIVFPPCFPFCGDFNFSL
ncbi:MAG: hypothetical protein Q7T50_00580 [Candidatus Magasanikbacteria bacterium]|nr:hypothetical protein [Candidatus Magasanikbacteria bacterium]